MKLTIEVVPQLPGLPILRDRLGPVEWSKVRKACFARAGYRCEICRAGPLAGLNCHEIWEYDEEAGVQKLSGFAALCAACYELKHFAWTCAHGHGDRALLHFRQINCCSAEEAKLHVGEAIVRWKYLLRREWTQDLSWFELAG